MDFIFLNNGEIIKRIASKYQEKRLSLNLTQKQLAKRANLSLATIKKFESGHPPAFKTVIAIIQALGEISRLALIMPEILESPKKIFENEHKKRKRARSE